MKVPIEVSARHIHLSQEDCKTLFGKDSLSSFKELSQPGQFAAIETVDVKGPKGVLENVRVVGPLRDKTQLEITYSDSYALGIERPQVKVSGDLEDTSGNVQIMSSSGSVQLESGIIVAQRHLHISPKEADSLNLVDGQSIKIKTEGLRGLIFENVIVRVSDNYKLSFQIDTDEANASGIINGSEGEIIL